MKTNNKGFSLVELIVVIAIMAILAAVAIPTFATFITKAQDASNVQEVADLAYAADLACVEYGVTAAATVAADKVTVTFTGTDAAKAATQVAEIHENASVVDETKVVLTFAKELSANGQEDAAEALSRLGD